jgi:hypothetical protein
MHEDVTWGRDHGLKEMSVNRALAAVVVTR